MKTVLVTGGTDGIGKGLALHYLAQGYKVFAVGSSAEKGEKLMEEANNPNLVFLQANLSLVSENLRIIKAVAEQVEVLDTLVLCAASLKPQPVYIETAEGIEFTFALPLLNPECGSMPAERTARTIFGSLSTSQTEAVSARRAS